MLTLYFVLGLVAGALAYKTFISDPQRVLERVLREHDEADVEYEEDDGCECDHEPEDTFEAALAELSDSDDYLIPECWTISGGSISCGERVLPALIFSLEMDGGENLGPFLVPFHEGGTEEFRTLVLEGLEEATRAAEAEGE